VQPYRIFRITAVAEAFSWAGLLVGMYLKRVAEVTDMGVWLFGRLHGALFVGCRLENDDVEIDLIRRGAHVIPPFDARPYPTHPAHLYAPEDLAYGFAAEGFAGMYDTTVYQHFLDHGGAAPDLREAIAQRLHDAGIDNALGKALAAWVAVHGLVFWVPQWIEIFLGPALKASAN